ncbi:DUF4007 family protein [Brumimicrobium oceani]|uniref:DUF4007 domain-containing protein n=1 Tax=Brumimicrobium oceani TaxID=2100725 RepID=A0A2U2XC94_9FLAO|nr:DUF4007 family protein [Brumimicrobium oceani]PWH85412.1 DUF4007 domain-containing protein [Brumimicrobium oceani]
METIGLKFSGHESFHCRPFWLKKGYDFIKSDQQFTEKSGIELGVGKNMVGSIRFWLKAFDIVNDNNELTELAIKIFDNKNGWDPFLEDEATLWLLHYQLNAKQYSTIYHLIFSELRKIRPEFTKNHFLALVNEIDSKQSDNIVAKDFSAFTRTYFAKPSKDKEESFSGLFTDLGLLTEVGKDSQDNTLYHIYNNKQASIPWQIILFCILDNNNYGNSISFNSLYSEVNGIGNIFAFNQQELENKLIEISENEKDIIYKNDAGVKEFQFKADKPSGLAILNKYYNEK